MLASLPRMLIILLLAMMRPDAAVSQDADAVPLRAMAARDALAASRWEELEAGLSVMRAMTAGGLGLTAIRISPGKFRFSVAVQQEAEGERVAALGAREGGVIAVNGGFFGEGDEDGRLFPVGLLRKQGHDHSAAWNSAGGFLVLSPGGPAIRPSRDGVPDGEPDILQSKPLLIEPGGHWAMNSNQGHLRKRTLVCRTPGGEVVLFVVTRNGLSLYEAGWVLRGREEGGFFGCDSALALDGGGSTQLWVAGRDDLSMQGETPVHNALVVKRR